jgi:succinoglycan biosynthesis transport protein ExoP
MTAQTNISDPPAGFGLRDIAAVIIRWRILLLATLAAGLVIGTVIAVLLKPVYRSTASLLIQSQDIPTTVVASPLTDLAEERIAKIREQILSRDNLIQLINKNGLYQSKRRKLPLEAVMTILRNAISVDLVSAAGTDAQRPRDATIAFRLSYVNTDPTATFHVAQQLTSMFVSEDKRLRSEQMAGVATFLVRRADELRDRLVELEAKRRSIEARYNGALPDQIAMSAQSTSSLRAEISRMDAESQGITQQNGLLAARSQDVPPPPASAAQTELAAAQGQLDRLSATYSDSYPDVIAARARLAVAQAAVARAPAARDPSLPLQAEVAAGRSRIAMLAQRRSGLVSAVSRVDQLVALAPQASYELNNLEREYDNLKQQYQAIREKELDAQVAVNLQAEGRGERFSVVDQPTFPLEAENSQRIRLIVMGAVLGLGVGMAFVLAWEVIVMPVHGPSAIVQLMREEPLANIATLKFGQQPGLRERLKSKLPWLARSSPS